MGNHLIWRFHLQLLEITGTVTCLKELEMEPPDEVVPHPYTVHSVPTATSTFVVGRAVLFMWDLLYNVEHLFRGFSLGKGDISNGDSKTGWDVVFTVSSRDDVSRGNK